MSETTSTPSFPAEKVPSIRRLMMPRDTNAVGTIFGGVILSYLYQAGAVEARKYAHRTYVTVAMRGVEFIAPVFVGDLVSFYTETERLGRTSVTVKVEVYAERRPSDPTVVKVTEATLTYVAIDRDGRPRPVPAS